MATPLFLAVFGAGLAVTGLNDGPLPATSSFASEPTVEQLYRDGNRVVAQPYMNLAEADRVCPNGHEVRRSGQRTEGQRIYLSWTLRCR
jgi:hypothetical protein